MTRRGRPKGKVGMQQLFHVESMYLSGMTCLHEGFKSSDIAHHFGWTNVGPCISKARKLGLLKRKTRAHWGSPGEPERVATSAGFAFACRHAEGGEALDTEAFSAGPFAYGIELANLYLSIGGGLGAP